jgi:hypothetical protein
MTNAVRETPLLIGDGHLNDRDIRNQARADIPVRGSDRDLAAEGRTEIIHASRRLV